MNRFAPPPLLLPLLSSCVLLLALSASATSLVQMELPELARSAEVIVHGTVRRMESRWSGDRRRILTDVEIQVAESLKGQAGDTVLVVQPGGAVDGIGQKVSGLAAFAPDEEVVVFLERHGSRAFQVVGLAQGKYKVLREPGQTRAMAVPEPTGDALVLDAATHEPVSGSRQSLPLEQLKASIAAALAARPTP